MFMPSLFARCWKSGGNHESSGFCLNDSDNFVWRSTDL